MFVRYMPLWISLGLIVVLGGAAMIWWSAAPKPGADPSDAQQVAHGRSLYMEYCAACHGASLQGQPNWRERRADGKLPAPPHDASGHTWHHSDRQLFDITKQGTAAFAPAGYRTDMKGFAEVMSDADIWAVLAYIKSTWPAAIRSRQEAANQRDR